MAVNHELQTPFKASELDGDELQLALVKHVPYAVSDAAEAAALDLTGLGTLSLILGNDIFWYDSTDTTTVHDGVTCLVTTDGKRFKADGTRVNGAVIYAVDDDDLTAPPGSEAIGDSYLLPAAPTGDWAAYGKHVAIYTRRGYVFVAPRSGMLAYIADEDAYRRYDGSAWQSGFGSYAIANGSLEPQMLEQALGWRVESELAAPPGSIPAAGTLYIVGASATGAWAGEDGNIARSTGSAWQFITAVEGMTVFNKATDRLVSYKSGSWSQAILSGVLLYRGSRISGSTSLGLTTTYSTFLSFGSYEVGQANNTVHVRASIDVLPGGNPVDVTVGLFVDTETTARMERVFPSMVSTTRNSGMLVELDYQVPDTAARLYYLKIKSGISAGTLLASTGYFEEVAG